MENLNLNIYGKRVIVSDHLPNKKIVRRMARRFPPGTRKGKNQSETKRYTVETILPPDGLIWGNTIIVPPSMYSQMVRMSLFSKKVLSF